MKTEFNVSSVFDALKISIILPETPEGGGSSSRRGGFGEFEIYLGQRGGKAHGTLYFNSDKINFEIHGGEDHYGYLSNILIIKNPENRCKEYFGECLSKIPSSAIFEIIQKSIEIGVGIGQKQKADEIKKALMIVD